MAIIGTLNGLNIKDSVMELNVGDLIPCEYLSSGGKFGIFKNLGNATRPLIPAISSDSPDGSFYFIHTGYDHLGRVQLVADRNIQHTVSWDSLNAAGVVSENSINIYKTFKPTIVSTLTAHSQTGVGLFDDIGVNEWNTNNVFYWSAAGNYIELDIAHKCDIWRRGTTTWDYKGKLSILKWNGSTYTDVTSQYPQTYSTITEKTTHRFLKGLEAGRYKFQFLSESRLDSEWIFYNLDDISLNDYVLSTRILSGGISGTDIDNEWAHIVKNNSLNTAITPGDNTVWNTDLGSWTQTTPYGYPANKTVYSTTGWSTAAVTISNNTIGYRPMLLVNIFNAPVDVNIELDQMQIWYTDTDDILLNFSITDKESDSIKYDISVNGVEIISISDYIETPTDIITITIPKSSCTLKNNILVLTVNDSIGEKLVLTYNIIKEDINDISISRTFNFDTQWTREPGTVIENNKLILASESALVTTTDNTTIRTLGKANILGVTIDASTDTDVQFEVVKDMTLVGALGEGTVYETSIDLSIYKDVINLDVDSK